MKETKFTFERGRGIVWVCDIQNSSKYLYENESAQAVEEYFQRLHWLGKLAVNAAGGRFVKWTGDGFLAWFPIELHRELGCQAARIVTISKQITVMNNVTGLGVSGETRFRLKHGITVEHDALLTKVTDENGEHFDLVGRSVVLAFRLTGMKASFPSIITQREIVEAIAKEKVSGFKFRSLNLSAKDRLKYFKGERWGTTSLYSSAERKPRAKSRASVLRMVRNTIEEAEKPQTIEDETDPTIKQFMMSLLSGPEWTQEVFENYMKFLREDMLGALKLAERALDSQPEKPAQ